MFFTAKRRGCSKYIFCPKNASRFSSHKGKHVDLPAPGGADKTTVLCLDSVWQNCVFIASIGKEVNADIKMML